MKQITEEQINDAATEYAENTIASGDKDFLLECGFESGANWMQDQLTPEWIPVTERLPEIELPVLVLDKWGYMNVCAYNSKWYPKIDGQHPNFMSESIISWMPLPESPKQ